MQFEAKAGRDLHTLARFDITRSRAALGGSLARFEGASALAEVMLRVATDDGTPADAFDALQAGLDAIATDADATVAAVRATWRLLGAIGFTPALEACVECGLVLPAELDVSFSAESGGVLCPGCAGRVPSRRLPASARATLSAWLGRLDGGAEPEPSVLDALIVRAHQRLLRIFVHAHLSDGRPLRAFDTWTTGEG